MSRWWPVALHASFVYGALAAGLGRINLAHNTDTLLQALISLLRWTPFYWGENRFGMLVPLLAAPIADPAANLLFQTVVAAWSSILAVWLMVRLTEDPPEAALATAISIPLLVILLTERRAF